MMGQNDLKQNSDKDEIEISNFNLSEIDPSIITDNQRTFKRISRIMCKSFNVPFAYLTLYEEESNTLHTIRYSENDEVTMYKNNHEDWILFNQLKVVPQKAYVQNTKRHATKNEVMLLFLQQGIKFFSICPIFSQDNGKLLGFLLIIDYVPMYLSDEKLSLLEDLAQWTATEIHLLYSVKLEQMMSEELAEMQRKNVVLSEALENTTASVVISNPNIPNNPITYINPAFTDLTGYTEEEILGNNCRILQGEDTDPKAVDIIRRSLTRGTAVKVVLKNYRKNGMPFWNELRISPVKDEHEQITHFVGVQTDITDQKRTQDHMLKNLFEQENLLQSIPDVIIMIDNDGYLLQWNNQLNRYVKKIDQELLRIPFREILVNISKKTLSDALSEAIENNSSSITASLEGGELFYPFEWTLVCLHGQDKEIYGFAAIGRDLTEEINMEQEVIAAGKIQASLLPSPTRTKKIDIETIYQPNQYVSGDSYGFEWLDDGNKIFIYLFDVMGHGVSTAIHTSAINLLFHQVAKLPITISEKLQKINTRSLEVLSLDYFTAAIVIELDLNNGHLQFASAGINKFICFQNNSSEVILVPGPFLGMFKESSYNVNQLHLSPGDHVHLLTDGIVDQINEGNLPTDISFENTLAELQKLATIGAESDDATGISFLYK